MDNEAFADAIKEQTLKLERILAAGMERSQRQEEILVAVTRMNGYVREHGEALAAHDQWIDSHEKTTKKMEDDMKTLSNRVYVISGGTGLLSLVATALQFLNL